MADRLYTADEVRSLIELHDRVKEHRMSSMMTRHAAEEQLAHHAAAHGDWPHLTAHADDEEEEEEGDEYEEEEEEEEEVSEPPMSLRDSVSHARQLAMVAGAHPAVEWARKQAAAQESLGKRVLEVEDVQRFIAGRPDAFVVVFAGWCGHCHHLLNLMRINISGSKEAGFRIDGQYPNVLLIEEKSASPELKEKLHVDGFPTVLHYKSGRPVNDEAQNALLDYVETLDSFATRPEILSVDDLRKLRPQRLAGGGSRPSSMGAYPQLSPEIARMLFGGMF